MEPRARRRPPAISVIVCTYNRARVLQTMLDSCRVMDVPDDLPWELIVVDNNSADDTERVVKKYQGEASFPIVYATERNQGVSHARNTGVAASRAPLLAFTDDDVVVDRLWLQRLRAAYETFDCAGVGGKVVPVWASAKPAWLEDGRYPLMKAIVSFDHGDEPCRLRTPPFGANMSFRRSAFERCGLFRTDLGRSASGLGGGEDTEFGNRLLRQGETLVYDPRVLVYHAVEKERPTKRYFERWYFAYGRTSVRLIEPLPTGLACFQVHARIVRSLAAVLVRWLFAVDSQRRFRYRLALCEDLGRLREILGLYHTTGVAIPRLRESGHDGQGAVRAGVDTTRTESLGRCSGDVGRSM